MDRQCFRFESVAKNKFLKTTQLLTTVKIIFQLSCTNSDVQIQAFLCKLLYLIRRVFYIRALQSIQNKWTDHVVFVKVIESKTLTRTFGYCCVFSHKSSSFFMRLKSQLIEFPIILYKQRKLKSTYLWIFFPSLNTAF